MQAYKKLEDRFAQVTALQQAESLLDWDRSVIMPERGAEQRARQLAVLAVKIHEMESDPRVGEWAAEAGNEKLNEWQKANLAVIARRHSHATAIPADLVEKKARQDAVTEFTWRGAKKDSNFKAVLPEFEKLVALVRECAAAKSAALGVPLYDALMDSYAPYVRATDVDAIFGDLASFLPGLIDKAVAAQKDPLPLPGPFPVEKQVALCRAVAESLGFDFTRGRLDVSAHPFSMGIGDDVRVTVRYDEEDFTSAVQAVAHEVGHGLFDRHTPQEWQHQPVGSSGNMGLAVHESQSLSLDMQLARGRDFWEAVAPMAQKIFGLSGPAMSAENLHRHASRVQRSFIRVEADEATYPAHIIFRYKLEREMVEGRLKPSDLPAAWNAAIKDILGITPPDDRRGCLQDIHWYCGAFGYFPAYALGAIMAAQFAEKMSAEIPDISARVQRGEFTVFTGWLSRNVHAKGCLYKPQELMEKVTGEKLSTRAFKQRLTHRYLEQECLSTSAQGAKRHA
jgi:carboxypeptidase Taq